MLWNNNLEVREVDFCHSASKDVTLSNGRPFEYLGFVHICQRFGTSLHLNSKNLLLK